jgi:hypothetical protein
MFDRRQRRIVWRGAFAGTVACLIAACGSNDSGGVTGPPSNGTLTVGASTVISAGTPLSLAAGSSGGEFLLVVTDTAVDGSSAHASFQVAASGISAAGAVSQPATSISPLSGAASTVAPRLDFSFASRLNERARRKLAPRLANARIAYMKRSSGGGKLSASRAPATVQVGDLLTLNVSSDPCDSLDLRGARVVAIGTQSIVVADTLDPPGGFTTADYQKFSARFDTLVYPLDVNNFGAPAVLGPDGKIILFFTVAVNSLTPKSSPSFVGGFFFDRDQFPIVANTDFEGCAGSNVANMFYLLTPDPAGTINGNVRTTGFVDSVTTAILAHEFQHLINASRRFYVNMSQQGFEVTWLNEGLSHIAEELLFYHEAGSAPKLNLDVTTLRASVQLKNAFNADQSSNAGRYREYLIAPDTSSPIRNDDSLSTRGATWDFLRYSADRKTAGGGADASVWFALVNSQTSGLANLRQVFGANIGAWLRDWAVSNYTDDVVSGESVDFTQPSWNWHSIYPALGTGGPYPLKVTGLTTSGASGLVIPGGTTYYRFSVAANATASITLTSASGGPFGVVVRLR